MCLCQNVPTIVSIGNDKTKGKLLEKRIVRENEKMSWKSGRQKKNHLLGIHMWIESIITLSVAKRALWSEVNCEYFQKIIVPLNNINSLCFRLQS